MFVKYIREKFTIAAAAGRGETGDLSLDNRLDSQYNIICVYMQISGHLPVYERKENP